MALILEIEHLLGVAFAAQGPDRAEPDWPPQPDRVFSALVATWASRGGLAEEREALEWLEGQPAPAIDASDAVARPAPATFVPPNDRLQVTANQGWRTRQPRRFPAALPYDPKVRLVWGEVDAAPVEALDALARDVAYIGHSASLTRCRFLLTEGVDHSGRPARRRIYQGRLRELEADFTAGRRPSPGDIAAAAAPAPTVGGNAFSPDWLTFEIVSGRIDLRAAPLACKALIKALMSGYKVTVGEDAIPNWVSGHEPDGSPARGLHAAVAPLAFAGFAHADGSLMGLALVPPAGRDDLMADTAFRKALLAIARSDDRGRQVIELTLGLKLALTLDPEGASLDPRRYASASRLWATVTPMVLDRHLKRRSGEEIQLEMEAIIAAACERDVGERPLGVVATKHSAVVGVPSAYPSGSAPHWMNWRVPPTFATRSLSHAVIEFEGDVAGPVLIGAGRFCGLGLFLPLPIDRDRG